MTHILTVVKIRTKTLEKKRFRVKNVIKYRANTASNEVSTKKGKISQI